MRNCLVEAMTFSWDELSCVWDGRMALVWYFTLFQQMYFAIATNTFCNQDKYILQVMTFSWDELSFVWDGKHGSGLWSDIQPCLVAGGTGVKRGLLFGPYFIKVWVPIGSLSVLGPYF